MASATRPNRGVLADPSFRKAVGVQVAAIRADLERRLEAQRTKYEAEVADLAATFSARITQLEGHLNEAELLLRELELRTKDEARSESQGVGGKKEEKIVAEAIRGSSEVARRVDSTIKYLQDNGVPFVDKRSSGGSLWLLGKKQELKSIIQELTSQGMTFTYAATGSKATKGRPGWYARPAEQSPQSMS